MAGIGTADRPFGVTLADVEEFDRGRRSPTIHNNPVRADGESYWDFMTKDMPGEDEVFTPEVIKAIRGD